MPKVQWLLGAFNKITPAVSLTNSPDLNPIENLWNIVKTRVEERMPKNISELETFMMEEWENTSDIVLINLVELMKKRCKLIIIIANNGERIPY